MYFVYSLSHPDNFNVTYFGITDNLSSRYSNHMSCNGGNDTLNVWIDSLLSRGKFPILDVIDIADDKTEVLNKEKEIIKEFSSNGILLNVLEYESPQSKTINKKHIKHLAMKYHEFK